MTFDALLICSAGFSNPHWPLQTAVLASCCQIAPLPSLQASPKWLDRARSQSGYSTTPPDLVKIGRQGSTLPSKTRFALSHFHGFAPAQRTKQKIAALLQTIFHIALILLFRQQTPVRSPNYATWHQFRFSMIPAAPCPPPMHIVIIA
jgi:hypothetical protein